MVTRERKLGSRVAKNDCSAAIEVGEQTGQLLGLARVVVEPVVTGVEHAHAQVRVDQPGDHGELLLQPAVGQRLLEHGGHLLAHVDDTLHRLGDRVVPRTSPSRVPARERIASYIHS